MTLQHTRSRDGEPNRLRRRTGDDTYRSKFHLKQVALYFVLLCFCSVYMATMLELKLMMMLMMMETRTRSTRTESLNAADVGQ